MRRISLFLLAACFALPLLATSAFAEKDHCKPVGGLKKLGRSFTNFDCTLTDKIEYDSYQECEQLCQPDVRATLAELAKNQEAEELDPTEFDIIPLDSTSWSTAYDLHAATRIGDGAAFAARDIYTVVKAELIGNLDDEGACSEFGFFQGLFNDVFGDEENEHATLTLIVSQQSILKTDFGARGFAIPLLQFERTLDGGCKYTRELNRSETLARLRSDGELQVLVAYTYNEGFKILENLTVVANSALGEVLNGAIGTAAPVISQVLGEDIGIFRNTALKTELTLPLSPQTQKDAYLVNVPLGSKGRIQLRIFQDPAKISSLADLKGITDLTDAVDSAKVLEINSDSSINPVRKTLREKFGGTVRLGADFFSSPSTDMKDLIQNCQAWRSALTSYGMTNVAVNRLLALMEREYWLKGENADHARIGTTEIKNGVERPVVACVDPEQFANHQNIIKPDLKDYSRNCRGDFKWVGDVASDMDMYWRLDPEFEDVVDLLADGAIVLREEQTEYLYTTFAPSNEERKGARQADYISTNLGEIARRGCWHSLASEKWSKQQGKGYCDIAYALFPPDREPIWVELNIDRKTGSLKQASVGIDVKRYIDFSEVDVSTGTSKRCAREISRQQELQVSSAQNP